METAQGSKAASASGGAHQVGAVAATNGHVAAAPLHRSPAHPLPGRISMAKGGQGRVRASPGTIRRATRSARVEGTSPTAARRDVAGTSSSNGETNTFTKSTGSGAATDRASNTSPSVRVTPPPTAAVPSAEDKAVTAADDRAGTGAGGGAGAGGASNTARALHDDEGFTSSKRARLMRALDAPNVDLERLKSLAWGGIPSDLRPKAWKILLGLLPTNKERQASVITRKRKEYRGFVDQFFGDRAAYRTDKDKQTLRDVVVDVPRTCPDMPLFHTEFVQRSLERVLFIWAMRHPASGYVQGINDIVTPFYTVMFQERGVVLDVIAPSTGCDDKGVSLSLPDMPEDVLMDVESDVYWCLANLLDAYQDHYTFSQPGIQRMVFKMKELVHRIDDKLATHVESVGIEWMHMVFRWMNCLLLRELPHRLVLRLWDALLCEEDGFESFHVYVCATLLVGFSDELVSLSFQELLMFLQSGVPEKLAAWRVPHIESLLGQAFINKSLFDDSPKHLQ